MLVPLFLIGGIALFSAPLFHPNNTCKDWLEKWGQLAEHRIWIPIHQVSSFGFAVGAAAVLLMCLTGPRHVLGYFGGAFAAGGYGMMSLIALVHASAVSTIGSAFNRSANEAERRMLRVAAEAFVSWDVAVSGVAAVLISGGAIVLAAYLWRIGIASIIPALVLAADGAIWGASYYRVLRVIHYSIPEWMPYTSLGLWLLATGLLITLRRREAGSEVSNAIPAEAQ
jgi:hypothetical protein